MTFASSQVKDSNGELKPILAVVCTENDPLVTHAFWDDCGKTAADQLVQFLIEWCLRFPEMKKIALAHKYILYTYGTYSYTSLL